MAEWSNAAVLKTVVPQGTGGSNPSFSARAFEYKTRTKVWVLYFLWDSTVKCVHL